MYLRFFNFLVVNLIEKYLQFSSNPVAIWFWTNPTKIVIYVWGTVFFFWNVSYSVFIYLDAISITKIIILKMTAFYGGCEKNFIAWKSKVLSMQVSSGCRRRLRDADRGKCAKLAERVSSRWGWGKGVGLGKRSFRGPLVAVDTGHYPLMQCGEGCRRWLWRYPYGRLFAHILLFPCHAFRGAVRGHLSRELP